MNHKSENVCSYAGMNNLVLSTFYQQPFGFHLDELTKT